MQMNLELRILLLKLWVLTLVLVCEYLKYSRLCPWLFKWPEYEDDQGDDQQDAYDN